jgi:hypothetical protein
VLVGSELYTVTDSIIMGHSFIQYATAVLLKNVDKYSIRWLPGTSEAIHLLGMPVVWTVEQHT